MLRTRTFYAIDVEHRIGRPDNQRPERDREETRRALKTIALYINSTLIIFERIGRMCVVYVGYTYIYRKQNELRT